MDPRLDSLFAAAMDLTPSARATFLERACRDAPELRGEVEELLACHDRSGGFLDVPAPLHAAPPNLGHRYRLGELLGRGAMGAVFRAQQLEPVQREVALKVMATELSSAEGRARFLAEQQAVASVDHANVARLYESGTTEDGQPYFAMELVQGEPIHRFCRNHGLDRRQRVALLARVCRAVHHAHQKGVVHRDLKPQNVLVTLGDGAPQPKVIDFGVAKAMAEGARPFATGRGELLGTLEYMSPEQAGAAGDVDTRADIYCLGVMLYELVTDALPLSSEQLRSAALAEALRMVREDEPLLPSLRTGDRSLRELDWLVLKAMAKDRARRYHSAADLAEDLERFLRNEPLVARPPSVGYRLGKFFRRHRVGTVAGCAVLLSITAGVVATLREAANARQQRDLTVSYLGRAVDATAFVISFLGETLNNVAGATAARRQQADQTLATMQQLAALPGTPRAADHGLGYAWQRVGEARLAMGESTAALDAFRQAHRVRARVAVEAPSLLSRRAHGVGHWKLSEALTALGRTGEAENEDRTALLIHRELVGVPGTSALEDGVYLGISLRRLAEHHKQSGRLTEARDALTEALGHLQKGLAGFPDHGPLQWNHAVVLLRLGELDGDPARLLAARSSLEAQSRRTGPANINERRLLATCALALAELHASSGDAAAFLNEAQSAGVMAREIADVDPLLFEIRELLATTELAESRALAMAGEGAAALTVAERARERLGELTRLDPDHGLVRCDFARAELAVADLHGTLALAMEPEAAVAARATAAACRSRARAVLVALRDLGRLPPLGAVLFASTGR